MGLDGESLAYRGVTVPQRTYDAGYSMYVENGIELGHMCFYQVPNGADEYALKFGGDQGGMAAWYYIKQATKE